VSIAEDARGFAINDASPEDGDAGAPNSAEAETTRRRLELALEATQDGLFEVDVQSGQSFYSERFYELLGYEQGAKEVSVEPEILGRLLYDADRERVTAAIADAIRTGAAFDELFRLHVRGGGVRWFRGRGRNVSWGAGTLRFMGLLTDVNDPKQAADARERLQDHLRQAQKLETIGTLAGGIAHDFNNVLVPVIVNTEMVLESFDSEDPRRKELGEVLIAARRARDLVTQILAFSRRSEPRREPFSVLRAGEQAVRLLKASLPATVELRPVFAPGCPGVEGDPLQLHQVITNLCTNAYQALPPSGGVIDLSVEPAMLEGGDADRLNVPSGRYVKVTVQDNGSGMSEGVKRRLFEPFFTTKAPGEGAGLGLSVVHGIVKGHRGAIEVESEIGAGTTFRVYLPASASELPDRASQRPRVPTPVMHRNQHILCVDDEEIVVHGVRRALERQGFRVTTLRDPERARALIEENPNAYDLLISDQTMPRLSGIELVRQVRAIRPDLPSILMTGFSEKASPELAQAAGARAFLPKPFSVNELLQVVAMALTSSAVGATRS
jgi:PAS domain S-box-containing protein